MKTKKTNGLKIPFLCDIMKRKMQIRQSGFFIGVALSVPFCSRRCFFMKNKRRIITLVVIFLLLAIISTVVYVFGFYIPEKRERAEQERLIREYYENKLEAYAVENAAADEYETDVAFLGDSLTDGYDLAKYYPEYKVSNRGIGGETSYGLYSRLDVSLYELKPKALVMLIGGNNLNTMLEDYEKILEEFKNNVPNTKVILCSLTAMGGDFAEKNKIAAYNNVVIKKLAAKYGYEFVDLYTPLFNVESGAIYDNYTSDGVHLTPEGYEVLTACIKPAIAKVLTEAD